MSCCPGEEMVQDDRAGSKDGFWRPNGATGVQGDRCERTAVRAVPLVLSCRTGCRCDHSDLGCALPPSPATFASSADDLLWG